MFDDAKGFDHIYLAAGYTDLRYGLDRLISLIENEFHLDPYSNSLFLFCGRKADRIKAVVWEGNVFLLLYKSLKTGRYKCPRNVSEALDLS